MTATTDVQLLLRRADEISRRESARGTCAVVVADTGGAIVFANARAQTLLGKVRIGAGVDDYSCMHGIFTEDGRPYPAPDLPLARAVLDRETVSGARMEVRRCDGTTSIISVDAQPLFGSGGEQIGGVAIFDEVGAIKPKPIVRENSPREHVSLEETPEDRS